MKKRDLIAKYDQDLVLRTSLEFGKNLEKARLDREKSLHNVAAVCSVLSVDKTVPAIVLEGFSSREDA
jgi:hypothetical protein